MGYYTYYEVEASSEAIEALKEISGYSLMGTVANGMTTRMISRKYQKCFLMKSSMLKGLERKTMTNGTLNAEMEIL